MPQQYFRPIPKTGRLPAAVVFDLDKTLINGDTTLGWTEYLYEKGIVSDPRFREANRRLVKDYRAGCLDLAAWLRDAVPAYEGLGAEERGRLVESFIREKIEPAVYRDAMERIEAARAAGMSLFIISASAAFLVRPIGRLVFGIDHAVGTDLVEIDGHLTPEIAGTASFQEGKIVRLREELDRAGLTMDEALFFTDSRNDLPLALAVGDVECVNPDHTLREAAMKNRWRVSSWILTR
ncbi:MAG: HAD family hydrolase [Sutterella sp.]|nr:HAD family hydrolase [Sutterella sp.]